MQLLEINLTEIIRKRLGPRRIRFVPGFLLKALERLIRQDDLNAMLRAAHPHRGSAFASHILSHLNITLQIEGLEHIPADEPLIFASNHPLGGLDGIALVSLLGKHFGDDNLRVLVNDLLLNVEPLRDIFLPVNKFGAQGREAARLLQEALTAGKQLVMFPAGLVSRLHPDGQIRDLDWQKTFVTQALRYSRRIIPIRFEALNTPRFYHTALWRKRLRIPFNLEQALLPSEVVKSRDKTFRITILPPINPNELKQTGRSPIQIAAQIRQLTNPEFGYLKKND